MTSTPINIPTRSKLVSNLTLLTLTLTIALATACGSSWGEGGDPAEIVADIAHELEIYDIDAYLAQDIPDDQRARFEGMQAEFTRYGIDLADANTFAKAIIDCCDYNNTTLLQGARLYVVDGTIDLDAVRGKLEEELYEESEASGYEIWESRGLREDFLLLNRVAVGIITDKGYVVMGDTDGVKETLHNLKSGGSSEESAMRQALDRHRRRLAGLRTRKRPDVQHRQHPLCSRHPLQPVLPGHRVLHLLCRRHPEDRNCRHVRQRTVRPSPNPKYSKETWRTRTSTSPST